jgi:hypothetical protein
MAELFAIPIAEQIREVERELALRENVYPRLLARKQITPAAAERNKERLRAVLTTLRRVERSQRELGEGFNRLLLEPEPMVAVKPVGPHGEALP